MLRILDKQKGKQYQQRTEIIIQRKRNCMTTLYCVGPGGGLPQQQHWQ